MQLLDELHARLVTIDYQPKLDPEGRRRAALRRLIDRFEEVERRELEARRHGLSG